MWHIKDLDEVTRDYIELGNGSINNVEILPSTNISGLEINSIKRGGNYAMNSTQNTSEGSIY